MNDDHLIERDRDEIAGAVHRHLSHDSAAMHVSGEAVYIDDMREAAGTLHLHPVLSTCAHGRIAKLDIQQALACPGVVDILTADDIPGTNDFGHAGHGDDQVLAGDLVEYKGQIVCVIAAETLGEARHAAKSVEIAYDPLESIVTIEQSNAHQVFLKDDMAIRTGDCGSALEGAAHRITGRLATGAQDHFYLEGQISFALPKEDGDVHLYASTQDPTAVQDLVARVLDKPANAVTVEVRRMGGAFGGKETQSTHFAAIAALAALKTGRPAKLRLDRDDDMKITGKRHEFESTYDVGFDDDGQIEALDIKMSMRCGHAEDQSPYILQRALNHLDNCYYIENADFVGVLNKTNTVSACAFRGFGSPQAMSIVERAIDEIAFQLKKDPLEVRKANLYGVDDRNTTHFGGVVHDNALHQLIAEIEDESDYWKRREEVRQFNAGSPWLKKGLALVPIKYGVGWGSSFFEQAGALMHVYKDGSVHLNHGGTEMGQGIFVKCAQVAAHELQIDVDKITVSSTSTDKVPNTTATAASTGTDFNGMAVQAAASKIRRRLSTFAAEHYRVGEDQVEFLPNRVRVGNQEVAWDSLISNAYMNRVPLSATGFYQTPENNYDPQSLRGQAHRYHAYGASCAEVLIDVLTGENKVVRVDIVHEMGRSINPAVDYGQLEGGFIQGMGWLTTEEVYWDEDGTLRTHAPSTYKIPVASDRPDMRMKLVDWSENRVESIYGSKAIGEPPFTLAISVLSALTDAIASTADYAVFPHLDAPATPERVLMTIEDVRRRAAV